MAPVQVSLAEAVVDHVQTHSGGYAFGNPGGYLSLILDSFRRSGMRAIRCVHEGAAAFAAAGYSQASHRLGVVCAQSGPGVTNLLTGVAGASMDSVPVLVLASQAPQGHYSRDGHQEARGLGRSIDQMAIFNSSASQIYRPPTANAALRCLRQACSVALAERKPSVVELAADLGGQVVSYQRVPEHQYLVRNQGVDMDAAERVARLVDGSERPVLVIGDRLNHRGATERLQALVETFGLPCVTTDYAKGVLPEDHPLVGGCLGQSGHGSAAQLVRESDLAIALGVRMTPQTTIAYEEGLFKRLVEIDEEPLGAARIYGVELAATSHLPGFVSALHDFLAPRKNTDKTGAHVAALRKEHGTYAAPDGDGSFTTTVALHSLRAALPRSARVTGDCGLNLQFLKRDFPIYSADGFHCLYGLAAMGAGYPLAMGVQLAQPDDVVVSVIGDGGMMVYLGELATAGDYGLPVIAVVINNNGYRQVGDRLEHYFGHQDTCTVPKIDFVKAAESMGVIGRRATSGAELERILAEVIPMRKPTLIDVKVQGDSLYDITPDKIKKWQDRMFRRKTTDSLWPSDDAKTAKKI